ncbi:MAG: transposase, partial [bacterium]|nr:transposase [bacterium]
MPPLCAEPIDSLHVWHDQQQPLVRALATPMVEEMTRALTMLQTAVDERDTLITKQEASVAELTTMLAAFNERFGVLEGESRDTRTMLTSQLEESHTAVGDLTARLHATTDRIDVLERQMYGQKSEKRPGLRRSGKTPDAKREARKKRRSELTDEDKEARRKAAADKRQDKLDALRAVQHTVVLPQSIGLGRAMPPVTSVVYEWHPGELVRIEVSREQRATPDGCIVTAPPVAQVVAGGIYGPALYAKICSDKCLNAMPLRRQERAFARLGAPLPGSTLSVLFHRAAELVKPIYDALQAHVSSSPHVSADEAPMPVLDEHATRTGWMWVFA